MAKISIIKSKYLIAADGSHSYIRDQLQIPFAGKTYELSLFVFDGKVEIDLPPDEICFSFTGKSSTGIFPLKEGRWRVDGTIPAGISSKKKIVFRRYRTKICFTKPVENKTARAGMVLCFSFSPAICRIFQG